MEEKIKRTLSRFKKNDETCSGEVDVTHIPFSILREIYPNPEDPMLLLSYPVSSMEATVLQTYLSNALNLNAYDYFLDAESK